MAVIMTTVEHEMKWKQFLSNHERMRTIQSKLFEELGEHLNAEIARKSVQNKEEAMLWLDATFGGVQKMHIHDETKTEKSFCTCKCIEKELDNISKLFIYIYF